jgi:hypothetical protein
MSGLLQELIDHIIDHVDDRKSIRACSLVCSKWSVRSRKHLFQKINFATPEALSRWCARTRPGPSGPSSFIDILYLSDGYHASPSSSWLRSSVLTNTASHFQSFSALRVLWILGWYMSADRLWSMLRSFGPSLKNVTHLTLTNLVVRPLTLAVFVSHFPRLDELFISTIHKFPEMPGDTSDLHRQSHADIVPTHPRGGLVASGFSQLPKEIFEAIALLEPQFRRVTLTHDSNYPCHYRSLIEACAGSLEELSIFAAGTSE